MVEVIQKNNDQNGDFEIYFDGRKAGLMTYFWKNSETFVIDHTEVDEAYGGKGLGKDLVIAAVNFARKNNYKIIPVCPFAKAIFRKDEEIQDVLQS